MNSKLHNLTCGNWLSCILTTKKIRVNWAAVPLIEPRRTHRHELKKTHLAGLAAIAIRVIFIIIARHFSLRGGKKKTPQRKPADFSSVSNNSDLILQWHKEGTPSQFANGSVLYKAFSFYKQIKSRKKKNTHRWQKSSSYCVTHLHRFYSEVLWRSISVLHAPSRWSCYIRCVNLTKSPDLENEYSYIVELPDVTEHF